MLPCTYTFYDSFQPPHFIFPVSFSSFQWIFTVAMTVSLQSFSSDCLETHGFFKWGKIRFITMPVLNLLISGKSFSKIRTLFEYVKPKLLGLCENDAGPVTDPSKFHYFWRIRHALVDILEESEHNKNS